MTVLRVLKKGYGYLHYFWRGVSFYRPKKVEEKKYLKNMIKISGESVEYILASSIVIKIKKGELIYYFRECDRHVSIHDYIFQLVDQYFSAMGDKSDKVRILKDLSVNSNFTKFANMGMMYPVTTPFHRFYCDNESPSILGLNDYDDDDYTKRLKTFCRFASNKIGPYHREHFWSLLPYRHYYSSDRNIAFNLLLELFGLEDLAPKCYYCYLSIDEKEPIFGLLQEGAKGICVTELDSSSREKRITPELQKNITNLNAIDYICCMRDHTPRNYTVILNSKDQFIGVSCFDNDDVGSFGTEKCTNFSSWPGVSLISENGIIKRPHFDRFLSEKINSIKWTSLYSKLHNCLNFLQIYRMWQRIKYLRLAISNTIKVKKDFLIEDAQWSASSLQEELSGKYGRTYLTDIVCMKKGPVVERL